MRYSILKNFLKIDNSLRFASNLKTYIMKKIYLILLLFCFGLVSTAQVLDENFDYGTTGGDLTTASGGLWVQHSGSADPVAYVAAPTSLTMAGYPSSGIGGHATFSGTSQDVNRSFTAITSGTVYGSALVNLSAVGSGNYFLHFNTGGFRARIGAQDDGNGNILFGIGTSSSTLTYGTTLYNLNTTYLLVFSYEIATGISNLHVLSAVTPTEPATPEATNTGSTGTAIDAIAFRQSSNIPALAIDGVRVATSWNEIMNNSSTPNPSLTITSPSDGAILYTQDVDISFVVQDFNVASPSAGDGYITYSLDAAADVSKFNTTDIVFTSLSFGTHTVDMELVDNSGASLSPAVTSSVSFTISQVQLLPYTDSFNYTDGELLANQPAWTNYFSGDDVVITTDNLSYSTLNGFGNAASFDGSGSDPLVDFTPTSAGKIYSSFMLRIDTFDAIPSDGYFAILRNDSGAYVGRVYISPLSATTYSIGVSGGGLDPSQVAPAVLNTGDTVFVVFNYDLAADTVELWVNPALGGAEPASDINTPSGSAGNTISQFLLRQDNPGATPALIFDELRIGTSWADVAPSTLTTESFVTKANFNVYPNPVSNGIVTIKSANNSPMTVTVFDVLGKKVLNSNVSNNTLNVSALKSGVYILNINQNNTSITKKLVIK